jgi:Uma2 family endonuclease
VSQFAGPVDTLLVIEVADTTLAYDRDVKAPLYARTGMQEFWLVDIQDRSITVFRQPAPNGYSFVRTLRGADAISPADRPEVRLTPNVLFP